jgi:hypothetical protein
MQPLVLDAADAINDLGVQSNKAAVNPLLIGDPGWQFTTVLTVARLKDSGQKMQRYQPVPVSVKHLDDLMVSFGKDLVYIADEYTAGVDNISSSHLVNASKRMQTIPAKSQQIINELKRLAAQYGV